MTTLVKNLTAEEVWIGDYLKVVGRHYEVVAMTTMHGHLTIFCKMPDHYRFDTLRLDFYPSDEVEVIRFDSEQLRSEIRDIQNWLLEQ